MKRILLVFAAVGMLAWGGGLQPALEVVLHAATAIKLATVVPDGSIWDRNLKQMAEEWAQASDGRVTVSVFGGGSQGDESTVLRKMRLDALQAASFTAVGLGSIDSAFNVFDVPFFFESYDELNAVTAKLTPVIAKRLDAKGFVLLNWGHGGWTQLFTKRPVQTLADLKSIKLYTSSGNEPMVQWFKANGFQPRPMAMTDIMTGLTTGMIEGLPTPALAAQLFQWYRQTPYMLDIGLAPVVGATVVTKKAWNSIAEGDRAKLRVSASQVETRLQMDVPKQDQAAVTELMKRGVTVTKASGTEWRTQADALSKTMRGEMVPQDIFDLATRARDEYRHNIPLARLPSDRPRTRPQSRDTARDVELAAVGRSSPRPPPESRCVTAAWYVRTLEDGFASVAMLAMVVLPLLEIVLRRLFGVGVQASGPIVQHLTLWVGFLGAAIAARDGKLLALATGTFIPSGPARRAADIVAAGTAACASLVLAWGGVQMMMAEREAQTTIGGGIPTWVAQLVLPTAFVVIAVRLVWRAGSTWIDRSAASIGIAAAVLVIVAPSLVEGRAAWPGLLVVAIAAVFGMPLFAILGGAAAWLFLHDSITPAAILIETYALSVSPTLPAIPLFTLAGFLLAEGRASERLLRVFRALVGWIPGGTAVVCAVLCSFFTVFTGGSGITILALGGVLFPALIRDGYPERFALGLLTASGSLGLLLPPALPLILYAVVAQIPIEDIFIGGILPGILLTSLVAVWGMRVGIVSGAGRQPFNAAEAVAAMWAAKWELAMPALVLVTMFSGVATAVEAAALTAAYTLVVQTVVHRNLSVRRDLRRVAAECVTVVGGVLVILGVAVGLTNYLVNAQVPAILVEWAKTHISSRFTFLLLLNVFLLAVGWLMEIFAAIVVVVPLIVPLGAAFGVHPVHLGIIFIANLELGFLTPLVGLNIFLASYRFKRPVLEVCRAALPMMAILGVGVLLITYLPWLTIGILTLLGRD